MRVSRRACAFVAVFACLAIGFVIIMQNPDAASAPATSSASLLAGFDAEAEYNRLKLLAAARAMNVPLPGGGVADGAAADGAIASGPIPIPVTVFEDHHHVLSSWVEHVVRGRLPMRGCTVMHIDSHSDLRQTDVAAPHPAHAWLPLGFVPNPARASDPFATELVPPAPNDILNALADRAPHDIPHAVVSTTDSIGGEASAAHRPHTSYPLAYRSRLAVRDFARHFVRELDIGNYIHASTSMGFVDHVIYMHPNITTADESCRDDITCKYWLGYDGAFGTYLVTMAYTRKLELCVANMILYVNGTGETSHLFNANNDAWPDDDDTRPTAFGPRVGPILDRLARTTRGWELKTARHGHVHDLTICRGVWFGEFELITTIAPVEWLLDGTLTVHYHKRIDALTNTLLSHKPETAKSLKRLGHWYMPGAPAPVAGQPVGRRPEPHETVSPLILDIDLDYFAATDVDSSPHRRDYDPAQLRAVVNLTRTIQNRLFPDDGTCDEGDDSDDGFDKLTRANEVLLLHISGLRAGDVSTALQRLAFNCSSSQQTAEARAEAAAVNEAAIDARNAAMKAAVVADKAQAALVKAEADLAEASLLQISEPQKRTPAATTPTRQVIQHIKDAAARRTAAARKADSKSKGRARGRDEDDEDEDEEEEEDEDDEEAAAPPRGRAPSNSTDNGDDDDEEEEEEEDEEDERALGENDPDWSRFFDFTPLPPSVPVDAALRDLLSSLDRILNEMSGHERWELTTVLLTTEPLLAAYYDSGLPEHIPSAKQLRHVFGQFRNAFRPPQPPEPLTGLPLLHPAIVTVCRSVDDGYTPLELWPTLERGVLRLLKDTVGASPDTPVRVEYARGLGPVHPDPIANLRP